MFGMEWFCHFLTLIEEKTEKGEGVVKRIFRDSIISHGSL